MGIMSFCGLSHFLVAKAMSDTSDPASMSSMIPARVHEEEQRSLTLLCDIQRELANALNSVGGKQSRGALDNYYFHSADHVNRIAEGFIFLRKSGRIDASKLLVRPLIETMFLSRNCLEGPFFRLRTLPPSITTSCV